MAVSALKATPTKLSRHQMILARNERPLRAMVSDICSLGKLDVVAEFDAGAVFGDVADDAIPGCATLADFGDAAINHLVPRVLASILHRIISQ